MLWISAQCSLWSLYYRAVEDGAGQASARQITLFQQRVASSTAQ